MFFRTVLHRTGLAVFLVAIIFVASAGRCLAETIVELVNPGDAPHLPLRYEPEESASTHVRFSSRRTLTQMTQATAEPAQTNIVSVDLHYTVLGVDQSGMIELLALIDALTCTPGREAAEETVAQLRALEQAGTGSQWQMRVNALGIVQQFEPIGEHGLAAGPAEAAALRDWCLHAIVPMPEAPVGVGAEWVVRSEAVIDGVTIRQESRMTLSDRRDDVLTIDVSSTSQAAKQMMVNPMIDSTTEQFLQTMESSGRGRYTIDLGRPGSIEGFSRAETMTVIDMTIGGARHEWTVTDRLQDRVEVVNDEAD